MKREKKKVWYMQMSAVSLSEAWNDPPPPAPASVPAEPTGRVSARRVAVVEETDDAAEVAPPVAEAQRPFDVSMHEDMLQELRALRLEESRRCTVYLAIGGILFAILFMYIDRLQSQIRMLNTFLIHRQMPTLAAVAQAQPHMPTQLPAPW